MVKVINDIKDCCSSAGCSTKVKGVYGILGGYVPNCTACSNVFLDEVTKNNRIGQTIQDRFSKTTLNYSKRGFGRKQFCGEATTSYMTVDYAFLDTFDSSSEVPLDEHGPNVGGMWTIEDGSPTVNSGYLTMERTSSDSRRIIIANDFGIANATLTFDMIFSAGFESGMVIQFNRADDNNYWSVYHSPPYLILFERTNSVSVQIDTYTGMFGYTSMVLAIRTNGDSVFVYKDEELVMSYNTEDRSSKTASAFKVDWFKNSGNLLFNTISAVPIPNPP